MKTARIPLKRTLAVLLGLALILAACQPAAPLVNITPSPEALSPAEPTPTARPASPTPPPPPSPTAPPLPDTGPSPTPRPANTPTLRPSPPAASPLQPVEIMVLDASFSPRELRIPPGTTVMWILDGSMPHTITADDGSFDSGILNDGDTFLHTFTTAGSFPYYCALHGAPGRSGMAGVIIVEAEGASSQPLAEDLSSGADNSSGYTDLYEKEYP